MHLVTYQASSGPRAAVLRDGALVDLQQADSSLPNTVVGLLEQGPEAWQRAARAVGQATTLALSELRLLPAVPAPEKIICIGLNYADHAAESGAAIPPEPVVFCKFPTALAGHEDTIRLPPISQKVDYEAELVVVIGRGGRNIPEPAAMQHVGGYTCGHDVSARDWQLEKPGGQWLLGKTFDTFAPIGPHLVTADEIPDPHQLAISLRLNGQTMQSSSTAQLIFSIPKLIAYVSSVATLKPGDLIFTGTPPGVGGARKPPVYMKPGDVAEVEIEKIGVLRNPIA